MQMHFKDKEAAIAYLEKENERFEEEASTIVPLLEATMRREKEERKKAEATPWWKPSLESERLCTAWLLAYMKDSLYGKHAAIMLKVAKNKERIGKILAAKNVEGFSIEV